MEKAARHLVVRHTPRTPIVISEGSLLRGILEVNGRLHIDGYFSGEAKVSRGVSIGRKGVFETSFLKCKYLSISGTFHGRVDCEELELSGTAVASGYFHCRQIRVEKGAMIQGVIEPLKTQEDEEEHVHEEAKP